MFCNKRSSSIEYCDNCHKTPYHSSCMIKSKRKYDCKNCKNDSLSDGELKIVLKEYETLKVEKK